MTSDDQKSMIHSHLMSSLPRTFSLIFWIHKFREIYRSIFKKFGGFEIRACLKKKKIIIIMTDFNSPIVEVSKMTSGIGCEAGIG